MTTVQRVFVGTASAMRLTGLALVAAVAVTSCSFAVDIKAKLSANRAGDGQVRNMLVRNVFIIAPPAGQGHRSAPLYFALVNHSGRADALVSVAAARIASAVKLAGGHLELAPGQATYSNPYPRAVLRELTARLAPGSYVPVTFTFRRAGSGTMQVPIKAPIGFWSTYSPTPSPSR